MNTIIKALLLIIFQITNIGISLYILSYPSNIAVLIAIIYLFLSITLTYFLTKKLLTK